AGNGSSNSIEPGAIRYELFVGNRTSSFDERQSACDPGNLPLRLRRAALRIHGRCNRLRATQNIHRRVSARRRRRLLRCSGAAVIWGAASLHGTWRRIDLESGNPSGAFLLPLTVGALPWPPKPLDSPSSRDCGTKAGWRRGQRFNYFNASTDIALKSYMHFLVGLTKFVI